MARGRGGGEVVVVWVGNRRSRIVARSLKVRRDVLGGGQSARIT